MKGEKSIQIKWNNGQLEQLIFYCIIFHRLELGRGEKKRTKLSVYVFDFYNQLPKMIIHNVTISVVDDDWYVRQ